MEDNEPPSSNYMTSRKLSWWCHSHGRKACGFMVQEWNDGRITTYRCCNPKVVMDQPEMKPCVVTKRIPGE